ncbi:hypothetical protein D3C86_1224860 [compost metagenome]
MGRAGRVLRQAEQAAAAVVGVGGRRAADAARDPGPAAQVVIGVAGDQARAVEADLRHGVRQVPAIGDIDAVGPGHARAPTGQVVLIGHGPQRPGLGGVAAQRVPGRGQGLAAGMAGGQTPAQQIIGEGDIVGRAGRIDRGDAVQGVEGRGEGLAGARAFGQRVVIGVVAVLLIVGGIGRVRAEGRHGEVQLGQPIQTVVGEVRAVAVGVFDPVDLAVGRPGLGEGGLLQRRADGALHLDQPTGVVIAVEGDAVGAVVAFGRQRAGVQGGGRRRVHADSRAQGLASAVVAVIGDGLGVGAGEGDLAAYQALGRIIGLHGLQ